MDFKKKYLTYAFSIYLTFIIASIVFAITLDLRHFTWLFVMLIFYYFNAFFIVVNLAILLFNLKNKQVFDSAKISIFVSLGISAMAFIVSNLL